MALWKRGTKKNGVRYWFRGTINGERFRVPLCPPGSSMGTRNYQEALRLQAAFVALAVAGKVEAHTENRNMRLVAASEQYLAGRKADNAAPKSIETDAERLRPVLQFFGDVQLKDIDRHRIDAYKVARQAGDIPRTPTPGNPSKFYDPASPRTINMDLGALRKVYTRFHQWGRLKDSGVTFLSESQTPEVGRAFTDEQQAHLLDVAQREPRWLSVYAAAKLASQTGLRSGEVKHLKRKDVNHETKTLDVVFAKTRAGQRKVALNEDAMSAIETMFTFADQMEHTDPEHYLWPTCENKRYDPTKPVKSFKTAWGSLTRAAGLEGFRFHDIRHTVITRMLEAGESEQDVQGIVGQISKRVIKRYSHARNKAMRGVVDRLLTGAVK